MDSLSIVIPTINEVSNITRVLGELAALREATPAVRIEVLVVDDGSTDGTPEQVEAVAVSCPWVKLVRRTGPPDLSGAVVDGWALAQGGWLGVMDGDLQHPSRTWAEIIRRIEGGAADLIVGSRFVDGAEASAHGVKRTIVSRLAIGLAQRMLGPRVAALSDPMSGMFAVRRRSVELESLRPMGYKILLETIVRSGIDRIVEVPIHFGARQNGASKAGLKVAATYGLHVMRLWGFQRLRALAQPAAVPAGE